jgi:hypothetical protein
METGIARFGRRHPVPAQQIAVPAVRDFLWSNRRDSRASFTEDHGCSIRPNPAMSRELRETMR